MYILSVTSRLAIRNERTYTYNERTYYLYLQCPGTDCDYRMKIPLVVKDVERYPYRILTISGTLPSPKLEFSTNNILLLPTPLHANITTTLDITVSNYTW